MVHNCMCIVPLSTLVAVPYIIAAGKIYDQSLHGKPFPLIQIYPTILS